MVIMTWASMTGTDGQSSTLTGKMGHSGTSGTIMDCTGHSGISRVLCCGNGGRGEVG